MSRKSPTAVLLLPLLLLAAAPSFAESPDIAKGRDATKRFYAGELDSLWEEMAPPMREALQSPAGLQAFRSQIATQLGTEEDVLTETVTPLQDHRLYRRIVRYSKVDTPVVVQWAFDPDSRIGGFAVRPLPEPAPSEHEDYETKADLRLPFDGEWTVVWGGRTPAENYHVIAADQRFAYDLLVSKDGSTHEGEGTELEDYHCWGLEILAPAAGVVTEAVGDLPDQAIGERDPEHPAGNHVVIDHGEGEYSVLAHLQKGSVTVEKGDRVEPGRVVGRCGNSGNTSEPHLHFHLQTEGSFGQGVGLPAQFRNYRADDEMVDRGEPRQGQVISPAPKAAGS